MSQLRSFVVMAKHDVVTGDEVFPDIKIKFYHVYDLPELLRLIKMSYGEDCVLFHEEGLEQDILNQIYESNGDGDWYFIIGEIEIDDGLPEMTIILD